MSEEKEDEKPEITNENILSDTSGDIQRVSLVSTSPSVRSIVRVVLIVLLLLAVKDFLGILLTSLTYLFFMIILSIFFAYIINPLVDLIQRPFINRSYGRIMSRSLAIALSFVLLFSVLGGSVYYLTPRVVEQTKTFVANVPAYTTSIQSTVTDLNRRLARMRVSEGVQTQVNEKINTFFEDAGNFITTLLGLSAVYILTFLPWLILVPILAFFLLKDAQMFRVGILRIVPVGDWRTRIESLISDVNDTLAAYARAQMISCVLIGVICTIGFYALGNDYALLLGILAGILELIPLLGPLTIAVLAISVAGLESGWQALWTTIFLGLLRMAQDYMIYPRIVREGIHLHPLAIILSVLAGEQIAGIPGVFIAIPVVALLTVLYKHILEHTDSRGLFTGLLEPKENKDNTSI